MLLKSKINERNPNKAIRRNASVLAQRFSARFGKKCAPDCTFALFLRVRRFSHEQRRHPYCRVMGIGWGVRCCSAGIFEGVSTSFEASKPFQTSPTKTPRPTRSRRRYDHARGTGSSHGFVHALADAVALRRPLGLRSHCLPGKRRLASPTADLTRALLSCTLISHLHDERRA